MIAELRNAERLETAAGQIAVRLAEQLDASGGTGNEKASVAKQLHASLAVALEGAHRTADPVDELAARRVARRGA